MQLDSARELKSALLESVIVPMATSIAVRSAGVAAQPSSALAATPPTVALGVARKGRNDFGLAVRIQKRALENSKEVETIRRQAKGEVDLRYIGRVAKLAAPPWHQKMTRPLRNRGLHRTLQDHGRHAGRLRPQPRRRLDPDPVE